jgi:DNA mismatch repair protein MutL
MGKIQRLPPALASQIAAGEVVERPASALKELLENALDAEATRCDIEIEGGGIMRLLVRDDGHGMSAEDARMSVERHATSKLKSFEELAQLPSFGFRGEALPSIASVSRFTLSTRARQSEAGTRVIVLGGAEPEVSEIGIPPGTEIDVRDLFYNVPARRKFLRSSGTEAGHISEVVEAAALSTPDVTFTLTRDGRKAREWLRTRDRSERVAGLFGDEPLARCVGERGPLRVEAYLGRPERARAGAAGLKLFCNQRPIRDRAILHTVAQAYGSVLERGRYPRGVVYIELPPQLVDVNVHPQKSEVRFADGRAVTDALYDVISAQLAKAFSFPAPNTNRWAKPSADPTWVHSGRAKDPPAVLSGADTAPDDTDRISEVSPKTDHELDDDLGFASQAGSEQSHVQRATPPEDSSGWFGAPGEVDGTPAREKQQSFMRIHETAGGLTPAPGPARAPSHDSDVSWDRLRFVAQVRGTYLLCEGDEGLFVLDQHAAAERVNFHRLKQQYTQSEMPSQALLFPVTLDVTAQQSELVTTHDADILRLGFEVRVHGENTVSVHRVPRLLQRDSTERLFRDLLTELARSGRGFSDAIDSALSTIACHGSVRAGDILNAQQAAALLSALDGVDFAGHCPHGRPIVAFTSWSELERKVGRR